MKLILIILSILTILSSSSLNAFDNKREGFYLSLGAGIGMLDNSVSNDIDEKIVSEGSIVTSFNIGYGFTNYLILHYSNNTNWYNKDESGEPITYLNVISGIGITYYIEDEVYLKCVYGLASDYPYVDRWLTLDGRGYEIGVGYDIDKHVSLELDFSYSNYDEFILDDGTSYSFDDYGFSATAKSLSLLIRYNWY